MPNYGMGFTGNPYYNPYSSYQPQPQTQVNTYANVNGLEGARAFVVQPNTTMLLMDSNNPYIYIKSANAMGQASIQYFKITAITEDELRGNITPSTGDFVNRSELTDIVKRIEALEKGKGE